MPAIFIDHPGRRNVELLQSPPAPAAETALGVTV